MSKENELGTLVIVVLKARNLNDKHSFYKQDVFAEVSLNGNAKRTKVDVKGGQHPIWDEEIRFPVMKDTAAKYRKLEVACFAKEHRSDDILGRGTIDLTDTLRTGEFDEWVGLDVDGVVRGDLYLEMTYFANAPAPATHGKLSVPVSAMLSRRPSKVSPSDRLYRPYQSSAPPPSHSSHSDARYQGQGNVSNALASVGTRLLPPSPSSSRSPSVGSSKRSESPPLPPVPEQRLSPEPLPTMLVPGGGGAKSQLEHNYPPQVPSILRPGSSQISHTALPPHRSSSPARHVSGSSLDSNHARPSSPNFIYNSATPHSQGYQTNTVPGVGVPQSRPVLSAPQAWTTNPTPMAPPLFPVPTVPQVQENDSYQLRTHAPKRSYGQPSELPDPYLQARYQTPLPLPPESKSLVRGSQSLPRESSPDPNHLKALQQMEEEVARRKQQEDKDRELALQLDRELNLADRPPEQSMSVSGVGAPMPGGW